MTDTNCPYLPDCKVHKGRCATHRWYSKTPLSHAAQELLLEMDLLSAVNIEDVDRFVAERSQSTA